MRPGKVQLHGGAWASTRPQSSLWPSWSFLSFSLSFSLSLSLCLSLSLSLCLSLSLSLFLSLFLSLCLSLSLSLSLSFSLSLSLSLSFSSISLSLSLSLSLSDVQPGDQPHFPAEKKAGHVLARAVPGPVAAALRGRHLHQDEVPPRVGGQGPAVQGG